MKKIIPLFMLALAAFGCTKSGASGEASTVKIIPSITRVSGLYFESGDAIGLTITKGGSVYADNTQMTYDGTAFAAAGLSWYDTDETSTLTACYPYLSGGMPVDFTISADQTQGCESSDLLVAAKNDVLPTATPVSMVFHHVMSELRIVVTNNTASPVSEVSIGGFIAQAVIDYTTQTAVVGAGMTVDVKAFEQTPDAAYCAVLVPQSGSLTVFVTASGKIYTKTLASATLESGKSYTMPVTVNADDIDVALSGDIQDWGNGGTLDDGSGSDNDSGSGSGDGDGGSSALEGNTLTYNGETYSVATFGSAVWMAQSLRDIPDETLMENGIWYPADGNSSEDVGMLYSFNVALQLNSATRAASGSIRGICPEGWHIPSQTELQQLLDSNPASDSDFWVCAGMWSAEDKDYISSAKGYFMSATQAEDPDEGYQVLVITPTQQKGNFVSFPAANGVSVRCVQDAD